MTAKTFSTTDGARIAYDDRGTGQPVVLLHGLGSRGEHWSLQRPALLEAGYRVITVDLRFHGGSSATAYGHHISRLGEDVHELVAHEGLDDVVLVGHSMGVSVILALISNHGTGPIARVVLIDQSPRIMNDRSWAFGVWGVTWDRLEDQLAGRLPWGDWSREPSPPSQVRALLAEHPFTDLFHGPHAALVADHFVADWREEVPRLAVPAWVATGRTSPAYPPEAMEWLTDNLPDARLSVYDRSGHTPHLNEPEAFNRDLVAFLREGQVAPSQGAATRSEPKSVEVLRTTESWNGVPYEGYPDGTPQLAIVRYSIPPHSALPWHTHAVPNAAFVMRGEFTLEERETGRTLVVHGGEAFGEPVGTVHRGYTGDLAAEIVVTYASLQGLPLSRPVVD